jgi:ABC-type glycerol-3-phosphate transport system substrate-binding protein
LHDDSYQNVHYFSRLIFILMSLVGLWIVVTPAPTGLSRAAKGDTIIQYWEKWTGVEQQGIQQIVDDFNNSVGKEKHIYVNLVSMSLIDQKTLVSTAAGVPPDVAGIWDPTVVQLGALGALEPLEDMAAEKGIVDGYYKPVYWKGCHYNGHLYALVSTPGAVGLFYNKKIFHDNAGRLRAAGLDPDRPPRTIDEVGRYGEVLNIFRTSADGSRHFERAGFLPSTTQWYATATQIWFGTQIWDEVNRKFILTDPRVVAAYDWIESYSLKYGANAVTEFQQSQAGMNSAQNEFIAGTQAMELQGPWLANYIHYWRPEMDGQWGVAPFPSADGAKDVCWAPFDALAIPFGCKHKREAFEFMAYVNRQDVMEKLCMLHCKNSPLAKDSDFFLQHHPNPYIGVFEELARSKNAYCAPQCPIGQEAGSELKAVAEGATALQTDPATSLAVAQQRLTAKWADYEAKQRARGMD